MGRGWVPQARAGEGVGSRVASRMPARGRAQDMECAGHAGPDHEHGLCPKAAGHGVVGCLHRPIITGVMGCTAGAHRRLGSRSVCCIDHMPGLVCCVPHTHTRKAGRVPLLALPLTPARVTPLGSLCRHAACGPVRHHPPGGQLQPRQGAGYSRSCSCYSCYSPGCRCCGAGGQGGGGGGGAGGAAAAVAAARRGPGVAGWGGGVLGVPGEGYWGSEGGEGHWGSEGG